MLIASLVIDAREAILIKARFFNTLRRLHFALRELEDAGVIQSDYIRIVEGSDEYLLGEEKALLEVIDGRDDPDAVQRREESRYVRSSAWTDRPSVFV